jgi:hypothetical protein
LFNFYNATSLSKQQSTSRPVTPRGHIRGRPFNLQGVFFRSEFFFRTTRELEYLFFSVAQIFFPEFYIRLYDKNSESNFFFPPPKSEYFFSNIGNENSFLEKKT